MAEKSSRLIEAVNLVYVVMKGSVLFWLALLSKGFVYGWIFAIKVVSDYFDSENPRDISFRYLLKQKENRIPYSKTISALMTFFFSLGLTGWMISLVKLSQLSFAMFYIGGLAWLVWLVIAIYYVRSDAKVGEYNLYESFIEMKQEFQKIIFFFLLAFIFVWLTLTKTLLGWVIFPGIYFYLVGRFKKYNLKESSHDSH